MLFHSRIPLLSSSGCIGATGKKQSMCWGDEHMPQPHGRNRGAAASSYLPASLQGWWISKPYSSKGTMKLFLALTKVFSSERPRLCSPQCRDHSTSLFSAGTDSCDVPGALGGLPMHFVSPVATILNAEQMFISTEMALIPFQLFSRAAIVCEYFFPGAKRCQGPTGRRCCCSQRGGEQG